MSGCTEAMEAIAQAVQGTLAPEGVGQLAAHCAGCARCREAYADATACAVGLRGADAAPRLDPADAVAWERALFLRLLAEEAAPEGRRPAVWSQLAMRLGRAGTQRQQQGEWGRWRRDAAEGASR